MIQSKIQNDLALARQHDNPQAKVLAIIEAEMRDVARRRQTGSFSTASSRLVTPYVLDDEANEILKRHIRLAAMNFKITGDSQFTEIATLLSNYVVGRELSDAEITEAVGAVDEPNPKAVLKFLDRRYGRSVDLDAARERILTKLGVA